MTALDQFDRLEALGQWRLSAEDAAREVLVSFGKATLVLQTTDDAPLTHWSLPALRLSETDDGGVVLTPDPAGTETLTIHDPLMKDALIRVIGPVGSKGGKRRGTALLWAAVLLVALGCAYWFSPQLLSKAAHGLIAPERRAILAEDILARIAKRTGPVCANSPGLRALMRFAETIKTGNPVPPKLFVADIGDTPYLSLPSRTVLLSRHVVEGAASLAELHSWTRIALGPDARGEDLTGLFARDDLADGIGFLATGKVSEQARDRLASEILLRPKADITPQPDPASAPDMSDADWVALQDICDD